MADKEIGAITLQARIYGREVAHAVNESGDSRRFQLGAIAKADEQMRMCYLTPVPNSGTIDQRGVRTQAIDSTTPNAKAIATTNFLTAARRVGFGALAAASASAGFFPVNPHFWRGDADGLGGFEIEIGYGLEQMVAAGQTRIFCGLCASVTPNDFEPSAILNMIGIGADIADTNLQLMHNDGTGTATKIDLGASFPAKTVGACYKLMLIAEPNGVEVSYWVNRIDAGNEVETSGTIASNLPVSTTLLGPCLYNQNGTGGGSGVETSLLGFIGRAGGL